MNMFKSNGGFTLVELIVVIAILAILAGAAIPAYAGYLEKAQDAATLTELDAIKTACFAVNATSATPVTEIHVTAEGEIYINVAPDATGAEAADLAPYYEGTPALEGSFADGADWTVADGWEAAE